ncbi:hypothetical protein ACF1GW_38610 [Streptomyces achromogenes]|uniref:hypothetical protein n=1 Tax=Streptomyces achromogenes TaxID=67255 RepID=UPI0036F8455F
MSPLTATAAAMGLLAAGYAVGRYRPAHRVSDWAHWQHCGTHPTGLRYAAMFIILSAENLTWMLLHPIQGARAWKYRNDPPPPRSPALTFDPGWAEKRRAAREET